MEHGWCVFMKPVQVDITAHSPFELPNLVQFGRIYTRNELETC